MLPIPNIFAIIITMIKRVAIFTDHADPLAPIGAGYMGGENVYVLELTRALSRLGWHTDVYTRASSLKTTHIAKVSQDARVIRLKAGPVSFVPRDKLFTYMPEYVESFLKFQKENKLEYLLIHGNYYFSGWAALQSAKVLGIPFVNTFHTLGIVRHNFLKDTDPSPHERIAIEKEIMTADHRTIATTPQMRDEMIRLYGT